MQLLLVMPLAEDFSINVDFIGGVIMGKLGNRIFSIFCVIMILFTLSTPNTNAIIDKEQKEIIIFVPGLMGTELYYDQEQKDLVWVDPFNNKYLDMKYTLYPGLPMGWSGSKNFENIPPI
jgi:hypothetical protein